MKKTETDRRFRNVMYVVILLLVAAYGVYKFQMISLAFSVWDGQVIDVPEGMAAK